jgi:Flp pilus assembly protein TadG
MLLSNRPRVSRSGSAAVEFAFVVLFLLVPVLLGVWEVGRLVEVQQLVDNAAREGARQAAVGDLLDPTTATQRDIYASDVTNTVTNYLTRNGLDTTGISVQYSNLTNPGATDPYEATQLDHLRVTVQMPFNNVRWVLLGSISGVNTLYGQADWDSMRDSNLTVSTSLPTN